jgi:hypothetical protein
MYDACVDCVEKQYEIPDQSLAQFAQFRLERASFYRHMTSCLTAAPWRTPFTVPYRRVRLLPSLHTSADREMTLLGLFKGFCDCVFPLDPQSGGRTQTNTFDPDAEAQCHEIVVSGDQSTPRPEEGAGEPQAAQRLRPAPQPARGQQPAQPRRGQQPAQPRRGQQPAAPAGDRPVSAGSQVGRVQPVVEPAERYAC